MPKREAEYFDRVYMTSLENYWIADLENTDTPFLAVYPDIVNRNIQRLISLFPGKIKSGRMLRHISARR